MDPTPEQKEITEKILETMREQYGFVPVVNQVLSERPDIFVPMCGLGKAVLESGVIDQKNRYLCAISAATAAGGEYCLEVQTKHALAAGATKDEVFEAMMIGAYMTMTKAESYAFRKFAKSFGIELE